MCSIAGGGVGREGVADRGRISVESGDMVEVAKDKIISDIDGYFIGRFLKIFQNKDKYFLIVVPNMNEIINEDTLKKANEWWENLPDITKIAIYEDYWDINEESE